MKKKKPITNAPKSRWKQKNLVQNTSQLHIDEEPINKWNVMKQQGRSKWKSNGLKLEKKNKFIIEKFIANKTL